MAFYVETNTALSYVLQEVAGPSGSEAHREVAQHSRTSASPLVWIGSVNKVLSKASKSISGTTAGQQHKPAGSVAGSKGKAPARPPAASRLQDAVPNPLSMGRKRTGVDPSTQQVTDSEKERLLFGSLTGKRT